MTDLRRHAIDLYDAFTHEHRDRRRLLTEMTALAGSVAAAEALIAAVAASPAAAQQVDPGDKRLRTTRAPVPTGVGEPLNAYFATPASAAGGRGVVMVIHENRGLNAHIEDVARRVALAGYIAVAPDFLSPVGGTPADADQARELIGKLDLAQTVAAAAGAVKSLGIRDRKPMKVGVVGFCWGGAMVNRVAVAAGQGLDAAVSYYGPAPDPSEAAKVGASIILQLAGNDARVNSTAKPWGAALKAAGKDVAVYEYPGVEHAFNNDTSAERYNAAAAKLAWDRTLALFDRKLR
ncbi:carboxymethylenebutenolidase [Sphingomonas spermidinifaciens]|uniref:Carboxymethylenebutenolidase n=1 Tax=Sphingomonas spermidinifaciens TaxID=1141889 RepID=A0A2A4B658_9SPHN|nr:dienelactone hydrolase family protein [Sphingomonas spermidinifaciens]PCD03248.1 carboxymethylenebutenolidase [Sphingomonas spermidinifaciens]